MSSSIIYLSISLISFCLLAFCLTWFLVTLCILVARRFHIMDIPDGVIKLHKIPTPYLGGVAVFFGTLLPCLLILPLNSETYWLLLGLSILLIVGLVDDIVRRLKPIEKFSGQLIAVGIFLYAGFYIHPTICSQAAALFLSGFWMLTIINAFNLIDVMDGLASTIALGASLGFLILSLYLQHILLVFVFAALIGSLLGFLYFNKPNASIYLGDAGSLFIGGFLATLPLGLNMGKYTNLGYLAPIIILAIPLLELGCLVLIRTYKKIPFYQGSPDHFSIFLQSHGWTKANILLYCLLLMIIANIVALLLIMQFLSFKILLAIIAAFLLLWFGILLHKNT